MIAGLLIGSGIATIIYVLLIPGIKEQEYMAGYARGYEDCRRVRDL